MVHSRSSELSRLLVLEIGLVWPSGTVHLYVLPIYVLYVESYPGCWSEVLHKHFDVEPPGSLGMLGDSWKTHMPSELLVPTVFISHQLSWQSPPLTSHKVERSPLSNCD